MSKAIGDVIAERNRQIEAEDFDANHDDMATKGQLATAGACYALTASPYYPAGRAAHRLWPWDIEWWKPTDIRRNLVKAAALIIAEIERIDRAATRAQAARIEARMTEIHNALGDGPRQDWMRPLEEEYAFCRGQLSILRAASPVAKDSDHG